MLPNYDDQKVRSRHDGKAGSTEGLDVHSRAGGVHMASAFAASRAWIAASPLAARELLKMKRNR